MKKHILILVDIVIILVLAVIAFGGVFAYEYFATRTQSIIPAQQNQAQNTTTPTNQIAGWQTYTDTVDGIQVKYPPYFDLKMSSVPGVVSFINNNKNINISSVHFGWALSISGPIPFEQYVQGANIELLNNNQISNGGGGTVRFLNKSSNKATFETIGSPSSVPDVTTVLKDGDKAVILDVYGSSAIDTRPLEQKDYSGFADLEKVNSQMMSTFKFTTPTPTPPTTTNQCNVQPNAQGICPTGCINYGVPLGCITPEHYQYCKTHACPI